MARPYSEQFILGLNHANPKRIGIKLAKVCVKAHFPIIYIADTFNVTRMSIHSWFRGGAVRDKNNTRIEIFIDLVEEGLANGSLPALNAPHAKTYLESEIKPKLDVV